MNYIKGAQKNLEFWQKIAKNANFVKLPQKKNNFVERSQKIRISSNDCAEEARISASFFGWRKRRYHKKATEKEHELHQRAAKKSRTLIKDCKKGNFDKKPRKNANFGKASRIKINLVKGSQKNANFVTKDAVKKQIFKKSQKITYSVTVPQKNLNFIKVSQKTRITVK